MMRRWLVMGLMVALWAGTAQAQTRISEDFEGTAAEIQARWPGQSYCCFPNSGGPFSLASAPVVNGAQSLRYNYIGSYAELGGFQCCQPGGSAEWDYHFGDKEIWVTWYSYMAPGFKTAGGLNANPPDPNGIGGIATKGLYQYMYSPATGRVNGWVFHYFYGGRLLTLSMQGIKDAPEGPYGTQNFYPNIQGYNQPDGQWTGYEAHFKLNTPGQANGLYELYVTPQGGSSFLSARSANREFVDTTTGGTMPSDAYWFREKIYRQDGLGSMYIDALRVTTTRIGLGTTPPPPTDSTPPVPPLNFRISQVWDGLTALVATLWEWVSPADASAMTPTSVEITWTPTTDSTIRYELRWSHFANGWAWTPIVGNLDSTTGRYRHAFAALPETAGDRGACWDARAVRGGLASPWLSETKQQQCLQVPLAAPIPAPIPLPTPTPVPAPVPVPTQPAATVTQLGDTVTIQCDKSRFTKMKTIGTGTKRVITCLQ